MVTHFNIIITCYITYYYECYFSVFTYYYICYYIIITCYFCNSEPIIIINIIMADLAPLLSMLLGL